MEGLDWIKQHLRIKSIYGTSQIVVFCQIWIAVRMFLKITIAKNQCKNRLVIVLIL